jgi:hypothetical protein
LVQTVRNSTSTRKVPFQKKKKSTRKVVMIEEDYGGCKQVSKVGLHIKLVYTPDPKSRNIWEWWGLGMWG